MRINVAKSSGFCFGVKRALEICHELLEEDENVYILGDIVHNQQVVAGLEIKGIRKLDPNRATEPHAKLVIRAHGAGKSTFIEATERGLEVVDATCPKVREIYDIAGRLERDRILVIIGDKDHDEVKGIAGQLSKRPLIIETPEEVPAAIPRNEKAVGIVTQSTQSRENILAVVRAIKELVEDVEFVDTTCRITRVKQDEIRRMSAENGTMLILGSRTSANTRRLYEISKERNERTWWLQSAEDLEPHMVDVDGAVGIMAGASTPEEVTREVVARLEGWTKSVPSDR